MRLNAYYNVGFDVFYLKKSFMWFCWRVMDEIRKIGKMLKKTRNEDKRWHGPQEADFFFLHYMRLNAYYNVGFDVFYLKKSLCDFVMDEIRKIGKLLKKTRNEDNRWHGRVLYLDSTKCFYRFLLSLDFMSKTSDLLINFATCTKSFFQFEYQLWNLLIYLTIYITFICLTLQNQW